MSTKKRARSNNPEWYTPPEVYLAVQAFLGEIDLDPCANPEKTVPAKQHILDNGLAVTWRGKVYMNPPYAPRIEPWIDKALSDPVDEIVMLLPSRTDTRWFHKLFPDCSICFVKDRIEFWHPGLTKERAAFPNALVYRGSRHRAFANHFGTWGYVVMPKRKRKPVAYQLPLSFAA